MWEGIALAMGAAFLGLYAYALLRARSRSSGAHAPQQPSESPRD
jgi:hypothetical protein